MKKVFLLTILFCYFGIAKAQLYFKNSWTKPVVVAFAMQSNSKGDEAWYSYGWYACDPNQTIQLSSGVGLNPNVYYYAKSSDGTTVWNGDNRDGSAKMLVSKSAFQIKNANMEYVKEGNSEYYWVNFRHITIKFIQTTYTIEIQ